MRSNIIVGFQANPVRSSGRCDFLVAAQLDVVGVFGYSDEDGTEAAGFGGKLDVDEIRDRVEQVTRLVEELTAQRAEDQRGQLVDVLIESRAGDTAEGRTEFGVRRSTAPRPS